MKEMYFKLNDNFETIIHNELKGKEIKNIKLNPTGWTNIVYEVETNDGAFFFRFPRDEFWSRTIVKDYEFAKYVYQKTDFDTIKLELHYSEGRPFSVHKKIIGTPLSEKMNTLNYIEIKNVCEEISKFMCQLHCINYNKKEIFKTNDIALNLENFLDELLNVHVSEEDKKFWKVMPISKQENCLVHGDLNSSNILLDDENHVKAVIDFGFGGFGNKYNDISRIIGRCPDKFKKEIIKSYESYSKIQLNTEILDNDIQTWNNIDNSYINYMRKIGIYK